MGATCIMCSCVPGVLGDMCHVHLVALHVRHGHHVLHVYHVMFSGLKGEADQVSRALKIILTLLDFAKSDTTLPDGQKLILAASLHMLPAQVRRAGW